jgi:metallo-beta-lactamase family protein
MHAHLDQSGRISLLIHREGGGRGKIYSTQVTKELALALFKERNGFDCIELKWFWLRSYREKACWAGSCKKNIKSAEYYDAEISL